jgi:hypothetical protein
MANVGNGHLLRVCDLCGAVDDHPRHVLAGGARDIFPPPTADIVRAVIAAAPADEQDRLLADLLDTSSSDRHLDCCREAGCPLPADDPSNCAAKTAGAESARGAALVKHLMKEA